MASRRRFVSRNFHAWRTSATGGPGEWWGARPTPPSSRERSSSPARPNFRAFRAHCITGPCALTVSRPFFLFCSGTVVIPLMTQTQHTITHHSLSADATWRKLSSLQGANCALGAEKTRSFYAVRRSLKGKRVNAYLALLCYASRDIRFRRAMREKRSLGLLCGPRTV